MTVRDYLDLAMARWRFILAGLLLGLAAAVAITWMTPEQYAARVTIYVSAQAGVDDAVSAYQGNLLSEQKVKSYIQLLTSHRIAADVVDQLDLDVPPATIRSAVTASAKPQTVLLVVTVTDPSPERAQRLADAVGVAFGRLVAELERPSDPTRSAAVTARVVEQAELPTAPVSPRPAVNLGLGVLLGLLAGGAAALVRHSLDTSVKSAEQLRRLTGAPNLGAIAFDNELPLHPLAVHERPQSPLAEAFRQLRTNLQFVDVDSSRKVVLVTSSIAEEGKTTMLCNLGIALAQGGSRVILVEGDLRRPRVAHYLGLEGGVGVTSLLAGRLALDQAIQPWGRGMLDVLASGPVPPNPSELVASRQMAALLVELGKRYDVVLVDAPPLLPVTDAAVLGTGCDGALLIVRHGRTAGQQVLAALAALEAVSVRLFGTVLTMAPPGGPDAYYHYYSMDRTDGGYEPRMPMPHRSPTGDKAGAIATQEYIDAQRAGTGPATDRIASNGLGHRAEPHDVLTDHSRKRHS